MLEAAGWVVEDRKDLNLGAAQGVAVRFFPLKDGLECRFVVRIATTAWPNRIETQNTDQHAARADSSGPATPVLTIQIMKSQQRSCLGLPPGSEALERAGTFAKIVSTERALRLTCLPRRIVS